MIAGLLLAAAISSGGAEFWHGTHYGMTLPQVLAAVPEAHRLSPSVAKPIGTERAVAEHLSLDGHSFDAEFWFHDDILDSVRLVFSPYGVSPGDGDWIKAQLSKKYGAGHCLPAPADGFCDWPHKGTKVGLMVSEKVGDGQVPMMIVFFDKADKESGL
jgi:hypothetical protein